MPPGPTSVVGLRVALGHLLLCVGERAVPLVRVAAQCHDPDIETNKRYDKTAGG